MSKKYMGSDKGLIKLIELIKTRFEQLSCDDLKSVSTEANQGLSDTEKSNARANIGAGTSSFSGNYNDLGNKPTIPAAVAVKGNAESSYRTGNVNLTPANIGSLATNGDSKSNTVTFTSNDVDDASATSWTSVSKLETGITHATFFQRVSQMFKNVRYLYKMLGTTNISKIGNGTVTGALDTLNSKFVSLDYTNNITFNKNMFTKEIKKDNNTVSLDLVVEDTLTANEDVLICTLPVELRPNIRHLALAHKNEKPCGWGYINVDGKITITSTETDKYVGFQFTYII